MLDHQLRSPIRGTTLRLTFSVSGRCPQARFVHSSILTSTQPLRQGTINITVTERGSFGAKICRVDFHHLWMQRLSEDLAKTSHVDGWRGRAIIVFQTHPGSPLVWSGIELPWGSISRLGDSKGYYQRTLGPTSFGGTSLPIDLMASISHTMVGQDLTPPRENLTLRPAAGAMASLQRLHETAGHLAENAPAVLAHPEAARGLEQALIEAMIDCLHSGEVNEDRAAPRQHTAIMRRFCRVIEQHGDEPLYIPQLCKEIGTSLRSLNVFAGSIWAWAPRGIYCFGG